jgi:hypothetical protein
MSVLKNTRHEIFAQQVAAGKPLLEAHEIAGYKPNQGNAGTLEMKVRERIREIKTKAANGVNVTVASLLSKLESVYEMAERIDNPSSAVQALMAQAKLAGLITDNQRVTVETVTNDMELARWISARLGDGKDNADKPASDTQPVETVEPSGAATQH